MLSEPGNSGLPFSDSGPRAGPGGAVNVPALLEKPAASCSLGAEGLQNSSPFSVLTSWVLRCHQLPQGPAYHQEKLLATDRMCCLQSPVLVTKVWFSGLIQHSILLVIFERHLPEKAQAGTPVTDVSSVERFLAPSGSEPADATSASSFTHLRSLLR